MLTIRDIILIEKRGWWGGEYYGNYYERMTYKLQSKINEENKQLRIQWKLLND